VYIATATASLLWSSKLRAEGQGPAALAASRRMLRLWEWVVVLPVARMVPIGPGGLQSGFSILRYVRRDFRKKKSGPRTPHPPGGPPVLGFLVWRAEGLPSTRNWPFRWPLSVTHQPAPGDTQGNVRRQLAGAVVLGGGAAPAPPLAGSGRSCASSFRVA
jgi:hypothetical protein